MIMTIMLMNHINLLVLNEQNSQLVDNFNVFQGRVVIIATQLVDNFNPFNSDELTITDRELSAIAAAAIIGFKKPKAAMGSPMVL